MNLPPRSLLWRTFLLVALLMLLSLWAWFSIFKAYENEPRAHQLTQLMASVVNLTRSALVNAHPEKRQELLRELSDREGIHVYAAEDNENVAEMPDKALLQSVLEELRSQLGEETRMTLEREGEHAVFVSFRIDDDEYWVALPSERIERAIPWQWLGWGAAALLLSLAGAYLIVFRIVNPLKVLSSAASEIGHGRMPEPVRESGPSEIAMLARAFNQMSANLARLDSDRALILAGISHDLRTPLARLRMGVEMSEGDATLHDGMVADIEEMDKTIDQFLDFARESSGEPEQATDIAALLQELAQQYERRGFCIACRCDTLPPLLLRPQALRRAIANLVDNALHYAGADQPVDLGLRLSRNVVNIDIADRGPGIAPADAERLKLPFTRLDIARGNSRGAGLGLAIVERIVRQQGGALQLLQRDGGGLLARISLPRQAQPVPAARER